MSQNRLKSAACAAALCASVLPAAGNAQQYPVRPVRVIVGFAAGGATDISARVLAQKMT